MDIACQRLLWDEYQMYDKIIKINDKITLDDIKTKTNKHTDLNTLIFLMMRVCIEGDLEVIHDVYRYLFVVHPKFSLRKCFRYSETCINHSDRWKKNDKEYEKNKKYPFTHFLYEDKYVETLNFLVTISKEEMFAINWLEQGPTGRDLFTFACESGSYEIIKFLIKECKLEIICHRENLSLTEDFADFCAVSKFDKCLDFYNMLFNEKCINQKIYDIVIINQHICDSEYDDNIIVHLVSKSSYENAKLLFDMKLKGDDSNNDTNNIINRCVELLCLCSKVDETKNILNYFLEKAKQNKHDLNDYLKQMHGQTQLNENKKIIEQILETNQ